MKSLMNVSTTPKVGRRERWWETYSKTLESKFFEFRDFCDCYCQNNSQKWTDREMLLNKIKLFEDILVRHGLALCSRSLEIAQI